MLVSSWEGVTAASCLASCGLLLARQAGHLQGQGQPVLQTAGSCNIAAYHTESTGEQLHSRSLPPSSHFIVIVISISSTVRDVTATLSVLTFRPGPGLHRGDGLHGTAGGGAEAAPSWGGGGDSCSWRAAAGPSCSSCRHPAAAQLRPLGRGQLVQVLDGGLLIPDNQGSFSAISLLFRSSQIY